MKRLLVALLATFVVVPATTASAAVDPLRKDQWALGQIDATQAWGSASGSGVTIAVVDTGIDLDHQDLKAKIASAWTCIETCKSGGDDDHGHGSHVAGIAAAATDNGAGMAGIAPKARLMAVKVLDNEGTGFASDIALGIRWAADRGARVVNLSLGTDLPLAPFDAIGASDISSAVNYAWDKGAVVVAAAGNDALPATFYTGTRNLLVVGATGPGDELASYSTAGFGVDVYAPGGDKSGRTCTKSDCVVSAWKGGAYAAADGTSMATPHVSGIAAMLLGQGKTQAQAVSRITSTTEDSKDGFPRVNAAKAVGAPAGGGGSGGGGGGGGGGAGGGGGSGGGGGGGSGRSPVSPSGTPASTASPGATPSASAGSPGAEGGNGPQAQGTPGPDDDLAGGNRALGLLVILGIAGAVYASSSIRKRSSKTR